MNFNILFACSKPILLFFWQLFTEFNIIFTTTATIALSCTTLITNFTSLRANLNLLCTKIDEIKAKKFQNTHKDKRNRNSKAAPTGLAKNSHSHREPLRVRLRLATVC